MKTVFLRTAALVSVASLAFAQGPGAKRETPSASVGGKKVEIDYGRPQLKGRPMADLLKQLPADRIWRAGENEVTTLTTETPLTVGSKRIAPGKYSVYVHAPEQGDWSLVLNADPGIALIKLWAQAPPAVADHLWPRLDGYDKVKDKEVARAAMTRGKAPAAAVDLFTITLAPEKDGAKLSLAWGDQAWSLDLKASK